MNPSQPSTLNSPSRSIHLHIERLILDGLAVEAHQVGALKTAAEAELTKRLTQDGLSAVSSRAEAYANAGEMRLARAPTAQQVGQQIGRSLFAVVSPTNQTNQSAKANTV